MDKRQKTQTPMIGGSALLIIFAVLCLTVFALLGFSTVQADKRLSDSSADAVAEYYAADCAAEELLGKLRAGELPKGVSRSGDVYSYACPISDTQELQVEVRINGDDWEILRWNSAAVVEWNADDTLTVWDGKS